MVLLRKVKSNFLLPFLLLALVILVRLPSISLPIDNDTGSNAYSARLILQGEPLYGIHHPGHQLPAVYYTYAAIFAAIGDSARSLKLFLIVWIWVNALFLVSIGSQLSHRIAGILAAVFFILVTSMTFLNGDSAEAELFANLPLTVVIWLAVGAIKKPDKSIDLFLIGVFSALSFLYKSVFIASLVSAGLMFFLEAALSRRREQWLKLVKRCALILFGFLLIFGLTFGYFAAVGLGQRFLLVFQLGMGYVSNNVRMDFINSIFYPLIAIGMTCAALLIANLFSAGRTLVRLPKMFAANRFEGLTRFLVVAWSVTSVIAAGASGFQFSHYALLLVPPFSLLAGIEIGDLWRKVSPRVAQPGNIVSLWLSVLMASAIIVNSLYISKNYFIGYISYLTGQSTLTEFVSQNAFIGQANFEAAEIAQYINQHTLPEERILTWTELAQICYLADRRSTSDTLWPMYVPLLGPMQRVLDSKPSYIVFFPYDSSSPEGESTEWLAQKIKQEYILETTIGNNQIYKLLKP